MTSIPPFAALRAFEATARTGGFGRAAADLNVSTSAVSHQIKFLEQTLGQTLLHRTRGTNNVRTTGAGARLLPAIVDAMALIGTACSDIRGMGERLVVTADLALSTTWLASRAAIFSALHPGARIDAIIVEGEPQMTRSAIDVAIVHIPVEALNADDTLLLREEIFPVCSPELRAFAVESVCKCRLLQEVVEGSPELEWANWSEEFGLPPDIAAKTVRYSSFSQVVAAAVAGAGLALGRSPLIEAELASGRLVRVFPEVARPASWCFVLRHREYARGSLLDKLVTFLIEESGERNRGNSQLQNS